jgi:septal ring factor EnvC (AmiA/AmiB activator)
MDEKRLNLKDAMKITDVRLKLEKELKEAKEKIAALENELRERREAEKDYIPHPNCPCVDK